jgi:hypothetical protein
MRTQHRLGGTRIGGGLTATPLSSIANETNEKGKRKNEKWKSGGFLTFFILHFSFFICFSFFTFNF